MGSGLSETKSRGSDHYIREINGINPTCAEDGAIGHWLYHEQSGTRFFLEKNLATELDEDEIIAKATGHNWGEWIITKSPTESEQGERMRICKNNSSHVQKEAISKLDPDDMKKGDDPDESLSGESESSGSGKRGSEDDKPYRKTKGEGGENSKDASSSSSAQLDASDGVAANKMPKIGDGSDALFWFMVFSLSAIGVGAL